MKSVNIWNSINWFKIRGKYLIRHFTWSWLRKWVEVRIPIKVKDEKASKKGNFLKNLAWISVWIKNLIMLGRVWRAYVTAQFFYFLPGRLGSGPDSGRPVSHNAANVASPSTDVDCAALDGQKTYENKKMRFWHFLQCFVIIWHNISRNSVWFVYISDNR